MDNKVTSMESNSTESINKAQLQTDSKAHEENTEKQKHVKLPLSRVKTIMKADPECNLINQDALFLVTKATELFVECLAKEAVKYTHMGKRKTIVKKDFDAAVGGAQHLCFLDGSLDQI